MKYIMAVQPAPFSVNTQLSTFDRNRTLHSVEKMQLLDDLEERQYTDTEIQRSLHFDMSPQFQTSWGATLDAVQ